MAVRKQLRPASMAGLVLVLVLALAPAPRAGAGAPVVNEPSWVPFVGAATVWCTMSNPGWSGCAGHHTYPAIDIGMPVGTSVLASGPGMVHEVHTSDTDSRGLFVAVAHPGGTVPRYLHLSRVDVSVGGTVELGQRVGLSGVSGSSTSPHLHYDEQRPYGTPVDPGAMFGLVDGALVSYPTAFGQSSWWSVPYGSPVRNEGLPGLFLDLPDDHPFAAEVAWMVDHGITSGYPDGTFRPRQAMTRQAWATFLYRLAGSPPGPYPDPGFADVPATHPWFTQISWVASTGIATGYRDGTFGALDPLTRQGAAAFLYRYAGSPPPPFPDPGFADVPPAHPFFDEIAWLASTGITTGYADGTFGVGTSLTRQGAAAFLFRYSTGGQSGSS